jgi:ribosomal protein S18 acetylase RimI-like enzyme
MLQTLTHRKATLTDLATIIELILEDDELAQGRESQNVHDQRYVDAFDKINADPNHYLMVVERGTEIVATCHLAVIPSLSFIGSTRLQIEEVRVRKKYRSMKIGKWMIKAAIAYGIEHGAKIVQLTANKKRVRAKSFYDKLGFKASHEGMKLYVGEK